MKLDPYNFAIVSALECAYDVDDVRIICCARKLPHCGLCAHVADPECHGGHGCHGGPGRLWPPRAHLCCLLPVESPIRRARQPSPPRKSI